MSTTKVNPKILKKEKQLVINEMKKKIIIIKHILLPTYFFYSVRFREWICAFAENLSAMQKHSMLSPPEPSKMFIKLNKKADETPNDHRGQMGF